MKGCVFEKTFLGFLTFLRILKRMLVNVRKWVFALFQDQNRRDKRGVGLITTLLVCIYAIFQIGNLVT